MKNSIVPRFTELTEQEQKETDGGTIAILIGLNRPRRSSVGFWGRTTGISGYGIVRAVAKV